MTPIPAMFLPEVYSAVVIAVTALVAFVASLGIRALMRGSNPLVTTTARRLGVTIVWIAGIVIAVAELGVPVDILLLVVGLLGVAAIVALRLPLENFGAKYFTDIYTPFKRGDTIRVDGATGKVIELNAMSTVLLTEDDHLVALPNSHLLRTAIANLTPQAWKELVVPITLSGGVDVAAFESEMLRALAKLRPRLDPRFPPLFTTTARTTQGANLVLTVMVRSPDDRDPVLAEVNARLSEGLAKARGSSARAPAREPSGA